MENTQLSDHERKLVIQWTQEFPEGIPIENWFSDGNQSPVSRLDISIKDTWCFG